MHMKHIPTKSERFLPGGLISLALMAVLLIIWTYTNPLLRSLGGLEFHTDESIYDFIVEPRHYQFTKADFPESAKLREILKICDSARAGHKMPPVFIRLARDCSYRDFVHLIDMFHLAGWSSSYYRSYIFANYQYGADSADVSAIESPGKTSQPALGKLVDNSQIHRYLAVNDLAYIWEALESAPSLFSILFLWGILCYLNFVMLLNHHRRRRTTNGKPPLAG